MGRSAKVLGALAGLAALAGAAAWLLAPKKSLPEVGPRVHRIETVRVGAVPRAFWLHVPERREAAAALVLELHGLGSSAIQQEQLSNLDALADREGFIVARPEGFGAQASFNAGRCCGEAVERSFDDVGLARAVIARVSQLYRVDPRRIYAVGFSNGGMLAQRLACELSEELAAVASVSGSLVLERCEPRRPISVLELHGTDDHHVGYGGGGLAAFAPVQDTMHQWAVRQRCAGVKESWALDAREVWLQKGDARCERYQGCAGGAEVALCRLEGAGHTWPGGPDLGELGKTSRDLDGTAEVWKFFLRH